MNKISFSISLLFFWVKGDVEVDSRFVKTNLMNTILGFIPAGRDQQNIPLKNISGSMLSTRYKVKGMLLGFFIGMPGLGAFGSSFFGALIFLTIGALIFLGSIQTTLKIEKAGTPYEITVPFFEKAKLEKLNTLIHNALVADTDKTDLNLFFDKKENIEPETV